MVGEGGVEAWGGNFKAKGIQDKIEGNVRRGFWKAKRGIIGRSTFPLLHHLSAYIIQIQIGGFKNIIKYKLQHSHLPSKFIIPSL